MVNYKILVTGSRDWTDDQRLREAFYDTIAQAIAEAPWLEGPHRFYLHSGACPTGADRMAEEYMSEIGAHVIKHPANWAKYGKRAGFVRNEQMVKLGADICLAFIKNNSPGASHTARLAEEAGIPTVRYVE